MVSPQLWKGRSDPVLHIELRRWADLMVVAPLDANTLAKVANGICDNLLVSTQALPATAATPQHCLTLPPWNLGASAASPTVRFARSAPLSSACLSLPQHSSPAPSPSFPEICSHSSILSLSHLISQPCFVFPAFSRGWYFFLPLSSLSLVHTNTHSLPFEFLYVFFNAIWKDTCEIR